MNDTLTLMTVHSPDRKRCVYFSTSFLQEQMMEHFCNGSANAVALLGRFGLIVNRMITFDTMPSIHEFFLAKEELDAQGAKVAGIALRNNTSLSSMEHIYLNGIRKALQIGSFIYARIHGDRNLTLYFIDDREECA